MKTLRDTWLIALKELKLFTRDRAALFFFIVFPFLFIMLFNFLMSGIGGEDERLEIHLAIREPPGGVSHMILGVTETKDEAALAPGEPKIVWEKEYAAARQAVDEGKLNGFLAFPADFTTSLQSGLPASLEIYADAGSTSTLAALRGVAGMISSQIGAQRAIIQASINLLVASGDLAPDPASINRTVQELMVKTMTAGTSGTVGPRIMVQVEKVGEVEAENPANFVIPGYLVMFVFFAAAMGAETIVKERKNNTLERLLATSVKREAVLGGIFAGGVVKGLV